MIKIFIYEYSAVDDLPLNFLRLGHGSLLFAEKNNLFENYKH